MHWNHWIALGLLLSMTACSSRRNAGSMEPFTSGGNRSLPAAGSGGAIVTPATPKLGRVTSVNASARYVIVTYSVGQLPARDSRLAAYRAGLKVAELKVTEFSRDINAVADIVAGECQVGDEVREN